jgi:hypothetical protein
MALFRNLGVKLRGSLCDVLQYVSAQPLVFLDLAKNCSFMNWKPIVPTVVLMDGHYLVQIWLGGLSKTTPEKQAPHFTGQE